MSLSQVAYPQLGAGQQPDQADGKPLHHAKVFEHSRRYDSRN
jgi:hypothetical protein